MRLIALSEILQLNRTSLSLVIVSSSVLPMSCSAGQDELTARYKWPSGRLGRLDNDDQDDCVPHATCN